MKPSEQVKAAGIKSLSVVETMTGVSRNTLINWHRDRPLLFEIVVAGCALEVRKQEARAQGFFFD